MIQFTFTQQEAAALAAGVQLLKEENAIEEKRMLQNESSLCQQAIDHLQYFYVQRQSVIEALLPRLTVPHKVAEENKTY